MRFRPKYNAKRTEVDGILFASKREAKRYQELKLLESAGKIRDLKLQVRFPLAVNEMPICTYVADFTYLENGERVVEDVKGMRLPIYRLKEKLMRALWGITIRVT